MNDDGIVFLVLVGLCSLAVVLFGYLGYLLGWWA